MARKTVNYTGLMRSWGHDYTITEVKPGDAIEVEASGWYTGPEGSLLNKGDFVLLNDPKGDVTRYMVTEVMNYPDPPDMWSGTLRFAPRPKPGMSEVQRHELALSWFEGKTTTPWMAKMLAEERCAEFGGCSEVIIGAYVDFLKGVEPK